MMGYWPKYVPVAKRREKAAKQAKAAKRKGQVLNPVIVEGRLIAKTFWGKAWCDNLEDYSDYENRLPRGRTYVRNSSVIDLQVSKGKVEAKVMGSSLYKISVEIKAMSAEKWKTLIKACAGKIDSLIELLQGKFSKGVMSIIIDKNSGLFPKPNEISMSCSCPDDAMLCKHIAAVLYGVGACLDNKPEWLFTLRHVDHLELVASAGVGQMMTSQPAADVLEEGDLSALFGIDMAPSSPKLPVPSSKVKEKVSSSDNKNGLTLPQAAELLEISRYQLTRLLDDQVIPFSLVGRQKRIEAKEIVKYRKKSK